MCRHRKILEHLYPAIGSAIAFSELVKPLTSSFTPIHARMSRHCLGIINVLKATDQASPNLCTLGTQVSSRDMLRKPQCLSANFNWWTIHRASPNQDYGEGVWYQICPAYPISRSEFWVWHLHFESLMVQEHRWMLRGLWCVGKDTEEGHTVGIICIFLNSI